MSELTHFDERGQARMVDVGDKAETHRVAIARGEIRMQPDTLRMIVEQRAAKGDVFGVARIAGIMAAKKTPDLIPLAHPIGLDSVEVRVERADTGVRIVSECSVRARTGVEMEALTAAAVAALALYDMVKGVERDVVIEGVRLLSKSGGRSGDWTAQ